MSKVHFFPVFDAAWKEACGRPANALSGFRSTGLVPFNPEKVDFSKLLDSHPVEKFQQDSAISNQMSDDEKVGLMRAFTIVENELSNETLELFKRCFDENYELEVDNDSGRLWHIYQKLRKTLCVKHSATSETGSSNENTNYSNQNVKQELLRMSTLEQHSNIPDLHVNEKLEINSPNDHIPVNIYSLLH